MDAAFNAAIPETTRNAIHTLMTEDTTVEQIIEESTEQTAE